ncbi:MAG TPA: hypothetical protein VJY62_14585, partial [Bacteroidia bacterium]|nr:hypothetical protein [Bacteroidia bacterium]
VSSIQYKKNKSPFYKKIFNRIIIVGGFALLFLLTPRMVLFEIFYRNFPEYVQAVKNLNEDPGNEELQEEADRQRELMYEQ